ncbi:MAG: Smr/MutS family protein [Lewinellaceae bacterium]|nr:Smr/MutS family protein [Lewinellaceae bacterium]
MLFAIGTKVLFRYTGERGTITARLDDNMLQVRLDSDPDLEIPAFAEDLVRDTGAEPALSGAKFVKGKQEVVPPPPPRREIKSQYVILKPQGMLIVFEPMPGRDGAVSRYKIWLVNDTTFEFLFDIELFTSQKTILQADGKLAATTILELGDLLYDDLSDLPEVDIEIRRITTDGLDTPLNRQFKIRPKQFFNNVQTAPILNVLAHQFLLFNTFEPAKTTSDKTNLLDYTRQTLQEKHRLDESNSTLFQVFDVETFANFEPEIDLHIENLVNGYARLDPSQIIRIQMQHFQRFLEKAIRLGVLRIFIIHGVGEGKLRDSIAQELRRHPQVYRFKNEYHPKYGYGATEVIFD